MQMYRRIGHGNCGSVWTLDDVHALKRGDGGPGRDLLNDYRVHQRILTHLPNHADKLRIQVPGCHQFIGSDDLTWWNGQAAMFPANFEPCNTLVSDRIPPFPESVRHRVIDQYCPAHLRESIKSSTPNQDCLIRPYLGRRRQTERQSRFQAFSLRNYPLHANQMEELGLDGRLYARIMAETLAHLYWRAQIDAKDVEFVLAPPPETVDDGKVIKSKVLGDHNVWLLDFDCCKEMPFNEAGVKQAKEAFYNNDPFFPRPDSKEVQDQMLWGEFKDTFLKVSETLIDPESMQARLPLLWVDMVESRDGES
ncbi:MAG: hypothetical protein Q9195_001495 [Heterodermia aff. obscurata]